MALASHWDRVTPLSALLLPASLLFRAVVTARRAAYRHGLLAVHRLPVPVVVVGNLMVGGTGKTPAVLWLARHLRALGLSPGIVSRGYGGRTTAPRRVMPECSADECGDEPLLLARRAGCDVWTGRDRTAAAAALLDSSPHCDVIISDDGLQHYRMARDIEICVIDGERGLGNHWLLPAGPLREPMARLREVDALLVNGAGTDDECAPDLTAGGAVPPRFAMRLEGAEFYNLLNPALRVGADHFRGRALHAVAGIGHPPRFFRHLQRLGLDFLAHPFPDHHRYMPGDIDFPHADAIVMSEKDAVKCSQFASETHWVLPVDAVIEPAFGDFVGGRLKALTHG